MGCFFACFGGARNFKHRKRRHLVSATPSEAPRNEIAEALQLVVSIKQEASENPITESKQKLEAALSGNTKKKVTFDSNVKNHEDLAIEQDKEIDYLEQKNEKKESDDDLVESKSNESKGSKNKEEETPKVPNHRYQNCATITTTSEDDYEEDLGIEESEINNDCDDLGSDEKLILVQEESSESLFSLSIGSRKQVCEVEFGEKEVNSPMPKCGGGADQQHKTTGDRSQYLHSVLNPVENLTQWKMVKARVTPPPPPPLKYQDKENINFCQEPSSMLSTRSSKLKEVVDGEIAVDTSLSSWLLESEATPMSKTSSVSDGNSPTRRKDKQDLGSLTVEEVNKLSASTSARQSRRRRSPEEPKVGTIGSYWSHTGKIIDSDSGSSNQAMPNTRGKSSEEDERAKWHSTPLQARFESWIEF